MNIVIPMAGQGQRFIDAGYVKPKPLIEINGISMIQSVIENINHKGSNFIFICLTDFIKEHSKCFGEILKKSLNHYEIVTVNKITEGAACTALLAKELINSDRSLVIANCDQLVLDSSYFLNSVSFYKKNNADGGILCFLNDSSKWSYVRIKEDTIVEVVEKKVVSNLATVGIYYYKQGKYFVQAAEDMIKKNIRVNNEFYVAPAYNEMINKGMKIVPFLINKMVGLGTPDDLEKFVNDNR